MCSQYFPLDRPCANNINSKINSVHSILQLIYKNANFNNILKRNLFFYQPQHQSTLIIHINNNFFYKFCSHFLKHFLTLTFIHKHNIKMFKYCRQSSPKIGWKTSKSNTQNCKIL